jgi:phosphatidylserine/phosphatidylglycerophosphate/cardiolipin synthase-like enzyme
MKPAVSSSPNTCNDDPVTTAESINLTIEATVVPGAVPPPTRQLLSDSIPQPLLGTVTSLIAAGLAPKDAADKVFHEPPFGNADLTDLDAVATLGMFPYRPSDLFLKMYAAALETVKKKPKSGLASPSLLGSSGVVRLSIVSTIPDIMYHYHQVILEAQREVLLATNAWELSSSSEKISSAIQELNRRAGREGRLVVFKLLLDAADIENLIHPHYYKKPSKWREMGLPDQESIQNINMEVINYHRAPLGTFHSKFMIVDRRIALVNSNNVNLRSNVEMMCHFEGDIVNSLYDTFLISWEKSLPPPGLPCLSTPAEQPLWNEIPGPPPQSINQRLNSMKKTDLTFESDDDFIPFYQHKIHDPVPMALVNRPPYQLPGHRNVNNPQNAAWLAALKYANESVLIQSPVLNAKPIIDAIIEACKRDVVVTVYASLGFNDLSEGKVPFQGGTNEHVVKKMMKKLDKCDKAHNLKYHWYTAKDQNAPIWFLKQYRNCHVKFLQVDNQVAIVGSGNQDTQSWYHSQEVNVMIDSPQIVKEWLEQLERNQNTSKFGQIDKNGNLLSGLPMPKDSGKYGLSRAKGGIF